MVIRRFALLCFALLFALGSPLMALAQDGTPAAGGVAGPQVGDAVPWIGTSGTEVGTVTVDEIIDPFDDFESSSGPDRGFHFVVLAVTVENSSDTTLSVDPSAFQLIDTDGFVSRTAYLYRSEASTTKNPDLTYGDLAAGDSISGYIGFQMLNGTEPQRVVFAPGSDQYLTIVDMRESQVALGTEVALAGSEGSEIGTITVNQVFDPFEDYDSSYAPDRGNHYVVIEVTVENTGTRPLTISAGSFYVLDTEGFLSYYTYLYRGDTANPPDFEGGDIEAGGTMTGVIAFQMLNGTEVGSIVYSNSLYEQQTVVGEPAAGGGGVTAVARSTPTPAPTATNPEDCQGLEEWFNGTITRISDLTNRVSPIIGTATTSPEELEAADLRNLAPDMADAAEAQRNSKPPVAGEDFNEALAQIFEDTSDALTDLADAIDSGDATDISTAVDALIATGDAFGSDEINTLADDFATACPELNTLGG